MDFASLIFRHAMEAIENSNEKELRQVLLWTPWIVHRHNQRGFTLLHIACSDTVCSLDPEERRANIERLLAAGADPLATFWEGDEPVSSADMCDTFGYEDDARFLREYIATGMWTRSAHPRNTDAAKRTIDISYVYSQIRVHLNSWRSPDQLIRVPRLTRSDGRYTVGGLTLVFFAYNVGEIKHKRELIEFLRHMNCTTTDPQPRHLGMQCGFNFLVRGCYHPAKGRILRTGEFSLLDLENPHPSSEMRHRRKDTAFTDASFNELKQKCGMRCMSCGSVEGGRHYKNPLYVTKLEMGHMDPRKPLSHPNCIPMCNMCNMVYKNCAVFNASGFIIEWLGGKGPGAIKDITSPVSHPLALVPDDDDEEDEAEELFDASEFGDTPLEDVYIDSSCISLMAPDTPKLKTVFPPVPLPSPFPVSMSARLPEPLPKPLPASFTVSLDAPLTESLPLSLPSPLPVPLPSPFPVSMSARLPEPLPKPLPASFTTLKSDRDCKPINIDMMKMQIATNLSTTAVRDPSNGHVLTKPIIAIAMDEIRNILLWHTVCGHRATMNSILKLSDNNQRYFLEISTGNRLKRPTSRQPRTEQRVKS
eukprot:gene28532-31690_t